MNEAEFLLEAESFAKLPFGVPDLAVVLRKSEAAIRVAIDNPEDLLGQAIRRGWLHAKAEKMRIINTLAAQGSTPAMHMALDFMRHLEL